MTPEKQREIASKGGRAAHQKGTAHEWTSEEARSAGRKGGQISRGGRGRLADEPSSGPNAARASTMPGGPGGFDGAVVVACTEACAYVETGSDGDGGAGADAAARPSGVRRRVDRLRRSLSRRPPTSTSDASGDDDTMGTPGLWFVPTGEVLPAKKWSLSAYRVNFDYDQGFTDVSNWPVTFGVGIGDRAEMFGAWTLVRRIDRDVRPMFRPTQPEAGGVVNEYPFVRQGWSDNQLGDFWLGGEGQPRCRSGGSSRWRSRVRGMVKLPTAKDDDEGVGTGKLDFVFDAIVSKEINQRVELSGLRRLHRPRRTRTTSI